MDVRSAILAAADHIERNPEQFYFNSTETPSGPGCGTPGCALGWIATFCDSSMPRVSSRVLGLLPERAMNLDGTETSITADPDSTFYNRLRRLSGTNHGWKNDPSLCAATLRKYADAFHPSEKKEKEILRTKRTGIPADILAIFQPSDFHRDRTEVVRSLVRNDSLVSFSGVAP